MLCIILQFTGITRIFLVASFIGKREKLVFRAIILGKIDPDRQGHYAISSEFSGVQRSWANLSDPKCETVLPMAKLSGRKNLLALLIVRGNNQTFDVTFYGAAHVRTRKTL